MPHIWYEANLRALFFSALSAVAASGTLSRVCLDLDYGYDTDLYMDTWMWWFAAVMYRCIVLYRMCDAWLCLFVVVNEEYRCTYCCGAVLLCSSGASPQGL